MPRILLICLGLLAGAALAPLHAAPADSLLTRDILALLDKLGMGYSRAELERNMASSVHHALQGADSATLRIADPAVEATVHQAFEQRRDKVQALQQAMADCVAARLGAAEIRELRRSVEAEPFQRLLSTLQFSSPQVAAAERDLMDVLNRDVQAMIRMRLAVATGKAAPCPRPLSAAPVAAPAPAAGGTPAGR